MMKVPALYACCVIILTCPHGYMCDLSSFLGGRLLNQPLYKGSLLPVDPDVCIGKPVTFNCTLQSEPEQNKSIVFFTKRSGSNYTEVKHTDVNVLNLTVSEFTKPAPEEPILVRCYYTEPTNGIVPDTSFQLGYTSTVFPSYETDIIIEDKDFECIVYNYIETMNCSWKYTGHYVNHSKPAINFRWRMAAFDKFMDCPNLNKDYNYCYMDDIKKGDFTMKHIVMEIEMNYTTCANRVVNKTFTFRRNTRDLVKPHPVTDLSTVDVNSTCITLSWSTRDSRPEYPKSQKIKVSSDWGPSIDPENIFINTSSVSSLPQAHEFVICNLQEFTTYTLTVSIHPVSDGFWSDSRTLEVKTLSDVPATSPNVTIGGYSWNPSDCLSDTKRKVCIMLQPISPLDQNGNMKGLKIYIKSKTSTLSPILTAEDALFFCSDQLLCNETYDVAISPYNDVGYSKENSTVTIDKWSKDVIQPSLRVDQTSQREDQNVNSSTWNQTVHLQWDHPEVSDITGYIVYLCTKEQGGCKKNNGTMNWYYYGKDVRDVNMLVNEPEQLSYGVSLITDTTSNGLQWVTCIYTAHVCPTELVHGISVIPGEEDNTLNIDWDKLPCKSGQPYIDAYIITYCEDDTSKCQDKRVNADKSSVVLQDLRDKTRYSVRIKGVNEDNCEGPKSEPVYGTPVNKSLKPEEITGIVIGVLTMCLFAAAGIVWFIRRGKKKMQKWKVNVSGIKMPEINDVKPDLDDLQDSCQRKRASTESTIVRQISNDSGVPETPKADENKNMAFTQLPNGYCKATSPQYLEHTDDNYNIKDKNIFLPGLRKDNVYCVQDFTGRTSPEEFFKFKDVKELQTNVDHSETSEDYRKAILTTGISDDDSNTTSQDITESCITSDTSVNISDGTPETLHLTIIPKPLLDSNFSFDNMSDDIKLATCNDEPLSSSSSSDSYIRSPTNIDVNSDQSSNTKPMLSLVCSNESTQSNTMSDDYMKSFVLSENDSTKSDHVVSTDIELTDQSNVSNSNTAGSNSSIEATNQLNDDQSLSPSNNSQHAQSNAMITTSDPYVVSPIQYDEDDQSKESYEFSESSDLPNFPLPSLDDHSREPSDLRRCDDPYVSLPELTKPENLQVTPPDLGRTDNPCVMSPDLGRTDNPYVTSPDLGRTDNPCVTSPDLGRTDNPYVTSPDLGRTDNPCVMSPDLGRTDNPCVTSPDIGRTDNPYVTSPDLGRTDNPCVTSPDLGRTDNPYVTSPDLGRTDNPCVMSPDLGRAYDPYVTSPDLGRTDNPYVTSPDLGRADNPYVTSPDLKRTDNPYVTSPDLGRTDNPCVTSPDLGRADNPYVTSPDLGRTDNPCVMSPDLGRADDPCVTSPDLGRADNPYVTSPDLGRTDNPYVTSPDLGSTDNPCVTSPDLGRADNPYVTSPDLGRADNPYVTSPDQGRADNPYVTSPDLGRTDNPYVTSPDLQRADNPYVSPSEMKMSQVSGISPTEVRRSNDPYVMSPDLSKPNHLHVSNNTNQYVQSPVSYEENIHSQNLPINPIIETSNPYIQSPLQYDCNQQNAQINVKPPSVSSEAGPSSSDDSSNPYITSPLPYDHNNLTSSQSESNSRPFSHVSDSISGSQEFDFTSDSNSSIFHSNADDITSNGNSNLPIIRTVPIPAAIETEIPENGSTNISESFEVTD